MIPFRTFPAFAAVLLAGSAAADSHNRPNAAPTANDTTSVTVSGKGVDHVVTGLVHSKRNTATGTIQQSTEIVDLTGDLNGRVLYAVTTVIDTVHARLVNTGDQVYSGTIAGSEPVMIHDNQFRFEVNLANGHENGRVYLFDRIAGPKVRCTLSVAGSGMNAEGNPTFTYSGRCTFRGR